MAGGVKSLAKDTAIYGLSSILGRFLNWCLTPLHVYIFTNTVEYGKVSYIYGFVALFMVLLTYGMETGFFRFMNKKDEDPAKVYSSVITSLGVTSILFIGLCALFLSPISEWMKYTDHPEHILMMAVTVAMDAFMVIPFAYLRYKKRPLRFAGLRIIFIFANIFFNLFFLVACPYIYKSFPETIDWFYNPGYGIGYIFIANLLANIVLFALLIPDMTGFKYQFDGALLRRIYKYSFPLLILGIAGVINQTVAQLVYPHIFESPDEAYSQLGIYNACLKITVVITMFTQAFRYAYEPFVFAKNNDNKDTRPYAEAMKYFIIFALFVFLGVMFFMDILKYIVSKNYMVGLSIVPIAMMGEIFFGIYFNLSVWYKLIDKTQYGATFSVLGCVITVLINIIFVPVFGFIASAWATFVCNLIIMSISYFYGQKYFPIRYDLKTIALYFLLAGVLYTLGVYVPIENEVLRLSYRTLLLGVFFLVLVKRDLPVSEIPYINKFFKTNKKV
ncbi:lipopolysaccharide biosynthesis protein [Dysgonomonas macrotermitis]|uniref:Membrane protein involved in the export of O-antigen and teichoic acid n=1 Tax=Dysgonomonas macrotermitis TaxID=1346286 RepID=A0A1M4U661_9BACT|nr:polysaccharide biosynthesis C-terminal domain-containing protein [Dysgonomonas macrotermitis]SHE52242.1 Membrane protein involved in the export of O-antigen and teichoic acid [Dysgonomonas macrotermitis]